MRRKAYWVALPLVVVIAALAFWWGIRSQDLLSEVKNAVAEELTRTLGTQVSVGTAELTAWNVVTLKDSKVFDRQGRILVHIHEATVEVDPLHLLWTRNIVESIGRIKIEQPEISLYRAKDGKWNFEELLTKDLPENRAFRGKLTIAGGRVHLHEPNRVWEISPVAGTLDFAENPAIKFRLNLRGQDQRARTFGTFTPQGYGVVTLQGQNQDLESWQGLLPVDWPLADLRGKLTALDVTLKKDQTGIKLAGEIRSAGISGRFANMDWTEIAGLITFSDQEVQFYDVSGKINGQLVSVTGKVLQPMRQPQLAVRLKTESFDPAALLETVPFVGKIAFDASVTGDLQSLQAAGRLQIDQGNLQGWSLTGFTTQFSGRREGEGWILRGSDGQGVLAGETLGDLQWTIDQMDRQLRLRGLWGRWGAGYLAADGLLGPDRLDVDLTAAGLPLATISRVYPDLEAQGALDFNGKLSGSPEVVRIGGRFQAIDGVAFHQPFTRALGNIEFAGGLLSLDKVEVRNGAGLHQIDGQVALNGRRELDLKVTTKRARAEDLVAWLAPGEPLTGNVENEVKLTGTLDSIEADGRLTLWEGSYQGFLLTKVAGNYRRQAGIITLDDFEVDSFKAKASISGTIDAKQNLNLSVNANEVELAYIQFNYPYPVDGKVSLIGNLTGTTTKPEFNGEVMSRTIKLNGQDLYDLGGTVLLRRDEIQVSAAHFLLGKGQVRASGGYRTTDNEIYGGLSVEETEISGLLSILNSPLPGVSGRLDGQVALTGTTNMPAVQVFGTMHGGRIKGYALDNIELDVSMRNRLITVNQLRASQGNGFVIAKGTADLNGPLAMEIGGKDIDAGILAALLNSKTEIQGNLNFLAQISGTAASPKVGLSMEIRNGGVTNATFDELFGLFALQDGVIQVNQLYIKKGEHRASVYGSLPLKALDRQQRKQATAEDPMDLKFRLDQANLSILPLLSPEVQWATGETKGEVHVGGNLAQPIFTGSITVADGSLKLKSLADPLEKLGLDIQFQDDKINVTRLSGSMGGGTLLLKGTLSLNGEQGVSAYAAELALDRLMVRHKIFKGPLNGNLSLTRQNGRPTLGGALQFENTTLNVLGIPETPETELDLGLDLQLVVGKNVRAYSPSLYDIWLGGGLHFGGTWQKPQITGKINLVRGNVEYIGTRFRIAEGSIDFPSRRSMDPKIHLEAYANLSSTKVLLNIEGSASQMDMKLSSIPALSPQEIRTVLALRPRSGDTLPPGAMNSDELAREEMRALLTSGLRMQVFGGFENKFREAFGLDDFRLVSSRRTTSRQPVTFGSSVSAGNPASLQEVYTLEFSKYFGDRVEVTYSMGLNRSEYLATVRYDLTSEFSFNASIDEKNSPRIGVEYRIRF